jgi:hypothetical protein
VSYTSTERSEEYNIPSIDNTNQNRANFITSEDNFVGEVWQSPGKISEDEKIEIIKKGFQLKGYSIKYEGIRKSKLYKQLKIGWEAD